MAIGLLVTAAVAFGVGYLFANLIFKDYLFTGELTEADEVGTAASLEECLTAPLVDKCLLVDRSDSVGMSAGTQNVDILDGIVIVAETPLSLCTCQIDDTETEQWNICVRVGIVMAGTTVSTVVGPLHDRCTIEEARDSLAWIEGTVATADTHVEESAVVAGLLLDILGRNTERIVVSDNLRLGCASVVLHLLFSSVRNVGSCREELLDEILAGKVAGPVVIDVAVWHTGTASRADEEGRATILLSAVTVLADREDNLLHSLLVLVIVAHEELLVTGPAVLCLGGEGILATVDNLIAVVLGFLIVLNLTIGVDGRVESQLSVKGIGSALVGTAEVLRVVVGTDLSELRLNLGQLLVNPVVKILATLLYRQRSIELILERSLVEEVKELIVKMEGLC